MATPVDSTPRATLSGWHVFLLALLSGILSMASWPNIGLASFAAWPSVVAWIAFVPYIYAWRRIGWRGSFLTAWLMGFVYFVGILAWIVLIKRDTNLNNAFTLLIFAVCGATYVGMFGVTAKWVSERWKWPDALVVPLAWTTWEYLRGHVIFGGWPWGSLGHTQYSNPVIRQWASTIGVGGLSWIIMWVNVVVTQELEVAWEAKRWRLREAARRWWPTVAEWRERFHVRPGATTVAIVFILVWSASAVWTVVDAIRFARAPQKTMEIALIQGNVDTTQRWDETYKTTLMNRMTQLHAQATEKQPDLVIWAESCFPGIFGYEKDQAWVDRLKTLIRTGGVPTILTGNEYIYDLNPQGERQYHHYNSAFLMDGTGETLGRYRKIKLVPFGEYIPWQILRNFLHAVVREPIPVDFEPGNEYAYIQYGDLRFSPLICYEDHFEELGYQLAKRGTRFFAGLANDRWAGTSAMSYQHTAMSAFLAIEHRVYMAKANMTGPTCLITPWGNISEPLPYFKEGVKFETIAYTPEFKTFFTRFGNLLVFACVVLFSGLLSLSLFRKKII